MFICGKGKNEYFSKEIVQPKATNPEFMKWKVENNMVMSLLINYTTNEISENFLLYGTTHQIWDNLKETYSSKNTSELFSIETILHDFCWGYQFVTDYFNTLSHHWKKVDLFEVYSWKYANDTTQ